MLKRLVILAVMTLALSPAAACAQVSGVVGDAVPAVATSFTRSSTLDEKALISAESAYIVAAKSYLVANREGLLSPAAKAKVKPALQGAKRALNAARSAYKIGDAATFGAQLAELKNLTGQVGALIPSRAVAPAPS